MLHSKRYKHVFFDLDHTLWDFEKNSSETLSELYDQFNLAERENFTKKDFVHTFHAVNKKLWASYNNGLLNRDKLREERFKIVFTQLGAKNSKLIDEIGREYLNTCPTKANLFPFAVDVLQYLKQHYILHIITNGFEEIQFIKLSSSKISQYFAEIVTSDASGFNKPHKGIFDYALTKTKAFCCDCIMVGDDLEADILGAKNASMDHIFFNPVGLIHKEKVTHEISCLSQLMKIL
ncbi:YjjG family noncanonical pyrimidine nucleotidase [soil metagenome]